MWRALVDTLVLHYPSNIPQHPPANAFHDIGSTPGSAGEQVGLVTASTPSEGDGTQDTAMDPPMGGWDGGGVLAFRHPRRLTLESSCLFMGRLVPVKVFEECRSDFWCEAQLPPSLARLGATSFLVGMRIPKEFIQLLLDDDHPMRMQTMLDAFDLRELSTLIADRLKLCRVGSRTRRRGMRAYRYWLDGATGEIDRSGTADSTTVAKFEHGNKQDTDPKEGEIRLSLRKRGVGQVLFSRLVSFWVPGDQKHRLSETISKVNGGRAHGDGRETRESPSLTADRIVQMVVSVKEIPHRGERGELRGETHDPYLGGRPGSFILAPELTRLLLENSYTKINADGMQRIRVDQYWRDALIWRLRATVEDHLPEAGLTTSGDRICNNYAAGDSNSCSQGEGNNSIRISVDEREPLFSLELVSAQCETPPAGLENITDESSTTAGKTLFDILLLPPQEAKTYPEKRRSIPAIELVATHRQTMAVFRFSVPAKPFAAEFRGVLSACLAAPTALRTELELPASAALRDMAGMWLQYSPAVCRNGRRAALTFSFPSLEPVTAEPYVGLRGETYQREGIRKQSEAECTGSAAQWRRRSSIHVRENVEAAAVAGTSQKGRPQNARGNKCEGEATTLQAKVTDRNERMVLRRSLAIPQLDELELQQKNNSAGGEHGRGMVEEEATEPASKILVLSVFEVFSTGPDGRVARHLKLCARDEAVRPAAETATVIPWVGTCEGVEGGALWRVITQGLGFRCIRDKKGKSIGICLQMLPQRDVEESDRLCTPKPGPDKTEKRSPMPAEVDASITSEGKGGEDAASLGDSSPKHVTPTMSPGFGEDKAAPTSCCDTPQAGLQIGAALDSEPPRIARTKIYDGWHRVTGIRLHVQCLQEESRTTFEAAGMANTRNADLLEKSRRPAGRGGTVSFPRASTLRFRLCDPRTGRRSEVQLSVEDALRNLSTRGGIVEARLLDAGRRPALAKSIAQQLQLVFDATGSYRVVLPLPSGWNRSASPRDGPSSR